MHNTTKYATLFLDNYTQKPDPHHTTARGSSPTHNVGAGTQAHNTQTKPEAYRPLRTPTKAVSMPRTPRPNYRTYQPKAEALRRHAQRHNLPCWICGQPINYQAHWKQADSFTADHVDPLHMGGRINGELRPAHRSCNTRRSNKQRAGKPASTIKPLASKTSRKW